MKILVLTHPDLVPPQRPVAFKKRDPFEWRTDYDVVHTLRRMGHEVEVLGVREQSKKIIEAIERFKPHRVFNLLDEFQGQGERDQHVASLLELLGVRFSGCGSRGLALARDKAISKLIVQKAGVLVPPFWEMESAHAPLPQIESSFFPLIVKSRIEQGSLGLSQRSVVTSRDQLQRQVEHLGKKVGGAVIIEKFIEGRELYVGALVEEGQIELLPIWEMVMRKKGSHSRFISTERGKWDRKYQKKFGITSTKARKLSPLLIQQIEKAARVSLSRLQITGYARVDFRLEVASGRLYFLEANPNPDIGHQEDFAQSWMNLKRSYRALLERTLQIRPQVRTKKAA